MNIKGLSRKLIRHGLRKAGEFWVLSRTSVLYVLYRALGHDGLGIPPGFRLPWTDFLLFARPNWYHDFSPLGVRTRQFKDPSCKRHQEIKQAVLFDYIDRAIALCGGPTADRQITAVELFCADGYFINYAVSKGVSEGAGLDLEEESGEGAKRQSIIAQARLITRLLHNEERIRFYRKDVFELDDRFDVGICAGGLYHTSEPQELLSLLHQRIDKGRVPQAVEIRSGDPPALRVHAAKAVRVVSVR